MDPIEKTIEEEKKTPEEAWRDVFNQTKSRLREINNEADKQLKKVDAAKRSVIKRCCVILEENEMPVSMICTRVTRELAEFASRKYIIESIDSKYKDQAKVRTYNKKEKPITKEELIVRKFREDPKKFESLGVTDTPNVEKNGEEESPIIWQIPVEQYLIQDLESYPKDFLIEIIKYLHNKLHQTETEQQPQQ